MNHKTIEELIENLLYAPDGWSVEADIIIDELMSYGEAVIKPLIYNFLAHPDVDYGLDNTYEVVVAMKQFGGYTVDTLVEALSDEDKLVRHVSARALGDIATSRVLPVLEKEMLNNHSYSAVIAIAKIGGDDAARILLNALQTTELDRVFIIGWLGATGSQLVLETLIDTLRDADADIRLYGISQLGVLAFPSSSQQLIEAMLHDTNLRNRQRSAYILATIYKDYRAAPTLIKELSHKLPSIREMIIKGLTHSGNRDYINQIYDLFLNDSELSVRACAAHSLVAFDSVNKDEAIIFIEQLLLSEETSIRLKALYPLRDIQHQRMFMWLKQIRNDDDSYIRFHAALIYSENGKNTHKEFLRLWQNEENHRLVKKAVIEAVENIESRNK